MFPRRGPRRTAPGRAGPRRAGPGRAGPVGMAVLRCRQRVRKSQPHQQALHLLRAVRRYAIVPAVITYRAALGG